LSLTRKSLDRANTAPRLRLWNRMPLTVTPLLARTRIPMPSFSTLPSAVPPIDPP
jgi:hypothetical protein